MSYLYANNFLVPTIMPQNIEYNNLWQQHQHYFQESQIKCIMLREIQSYNTPGQKEFMFRQYWK